MVVDAPHLSYQGNSVCLIRAVWHYSRRTHEAAAANTPPPALATSPPPSPQLSWEREVRGGRRRRRRRGRHRGGGGVTLHPQKKSALTHSCRSLMTVRTRWMVWAQWAVCEAWFMGHPNHCGLPAFQGGSLRLGKPRDTPLAIIVWQFCHAPRQADWIYCEWTCAIIELNISWRTHWGSEIVF